MVSCYAHSCNKRSHQDSFVPFPWRDRKRAELWLAKCGRLPRTKQELTKFNYRGKFLCSAHFRKDDFLPDFRRTLMPSEKWIGVKVKDDALPSIFEHPHARTRPAPTPAALGHAVGSKPSTPCFPLPTTPSHKSQQDSFSMSTSPSTSTITSISPRQQRMERKERMEFIHDVLFTEAEPLPLPKVKPSTSSTKKLKKPNTELTKQGPKDASTQTDPDVKCVAIQAHLSCSDKEVQCCLQDFDSCMPSTHQGDLPNISGDLNISMSSDIRSISPMTETTFLSAESRLFSPETSPPLAQSSPGDPDPTDPDWTPSKESDTLDIDEKEEMDEAAAVSDPKTQVLEKKYIVFESNLTSLCSKTMCPLCQLPPDTVKQHTVGSMFVAVMSCMEGHKWSWKSQPEIGHMPVGNMLIASAILFTGGTFQQASSFASELNLAFISSSVFYEKQRSVLLPVVMARWEREQQQIFSTLVEQDPVSLAGDGRCDSPGYSAKYGTYSFFENGTNKIIHFELVQVSEAKSSQGMEKLGLERGLEFLEERIEISQLTTDRHAGIRKMMSSNYDHIDHQFDVWHIAKNIRKRLTEKAKRKSTQALFKWIKSINNHTWWCPSSSHNNPDLLVEKWRSMTYHSVNIHTWGRDKSYKLFKKCEHPRMNKNDRDWLKPGSDAHEALKSVVFDEKLQKDLRKTSSFTHTGCLESFHSLLLKYCTKRLHFRYQTMKGRTALAILDYNENVNREQARVMKKTSASGPVGSLRYKFSCPKFKKEWVSQPIREAKTYRFRSEMMVECLKVVAKEITVESESMNLPRNIAPSSRPPTDEILAKRDILSRF